MTQQKAIDELNSCHAFGLSSECRSLAKIALEKQIPKKPYKQQAMIDFVDYQSEEDCYECPNCDSFLGYVDECKEAYQDNYCHNCGQKLDWNE